MYSLCLRQFLCVALCMGASLGSLGCSTGQAPQTEDPPADSAPPTPTAPAQKGDEAGDPLTVERLREQLGIGDAGQIRKVGGRIVAVDLQQVPLKDLSPLRGLPLKQLFLEETRVEDLTPLAGMPLEQLYLSGTQVRDLSPLAGMRLKELNLVGTPLSDITPLKEVEFDTLWIPQTDVQDLTPLAGKSFTSLDLQETPIKDLSPLAGNQELRRLHIGGTQVSDLSPLAGLQLQRLIFSPERITSGMDAIRNMTSLQGLDVSFDGNSPVMTPEEFWNRYDQGEWEQQTPPAQ